MGARGDLGGRGEAAVPRRERAVQGRARRHRGRRHLALHARRLHRSLPRAAPAGLEADQGDQAHLARGRLLARRREEQAADPDLRHRLLLPGRPRRVPRAAGAGEGARPPQARPRARPLPSLRGVARIAVLAPEGDGALERARGPAAAREQAPRLRRGEDAADLRHGGLGHERPLGQVPRQHVPRRGRRRGAACGPEADELPRAHAPVRLAAAQLPRPADPLRRELDPAPQRAGWRAPRPAPGPPRHPGRRSHLLHRGAGGRPRSTAASSTSRISTRSSTSRRAPSCRRAPTTASAPTRSGITPRGSCRPRSSGTGSST